MQLFCCNARMQIVLARANIAALCRIRNLPQSYSYKAQPYESKICYWRSTIWILLPRSIAQLTIERNQKADSICLFTLPENWKETEDFASPVSFWFVFVVSLSQRQLNLMTLLKWGTPFNSVSNRQFVECRYLGRANALFSKELIKPCSCCPSAQYREDSRRLHDKRV